MPSFLLPTDRHDDGRLIPCGAVARCADVPRPSQDQVGRVAHDSLRRWRCLCPTASFSGSGVRCSQRQRLPPALGLLVLGVFAVQPPDDSVYRMSLATPSGVLVGVERATPRRLVYCVAFVGLWVSYTFYSANLDNEPFEHVGWALLAMSVALGFAVGRWWAPLVVIVYLPTLAIPSAYGGGTPDYGVGLAVAVVVLPVVAGLIAIGVLARKTFSPRAGRYRQG